ncbi:MAG: YciI family protein [Pseudomonadota bacterium]
MQFIVTGYDGTDDQALERRLAAREAHLKQARVLYDKGKWLYAAAVLNEQGNMAGSVIVCEFPSREALDREWLKNEPYILGDVWKTVDIKRAQVAPFCAGPLKG